MKTIKRYDNRKLYDTEKSSYINLNDIIELVKLEKPFKIIDKDKSIITRKVLAQAIVQLAESFTEDELISMIKLVGKA